jgi:acyl-homoserine-lactone acylase
MTSRREFIASAAAVGAIAALPKASAILSSASFVLPAQGTEILWDHYGIPHIFAPDRASLFYAYGYAQMEAHSELLICLYTQARGRSAEFYGEEYLDTDRWIRVNGIPERAEQWATQQSPEFAPLLAAFVEGLNGWGKEHNDSLSTAAKAALPFKIEDVLGHGLHVIHYDWLVSASKVELRLKNASLEVHGSNEWAIAPSHSANGHSMLMSNSHLEWRGIHTYFEVQLTAPGVTSYGAVWVGFPVLRQCFTELVGWTQTTNNPNGGDLYNLTLKDGGYILDGKVCQFEVTKQKIKVRQKDGTVRDELLTIRRSEHGPLVVDQAGTAIALRVTALDRPGLFEQFWKMGLARNFAEFQDAMRMQQLPLFNTAYADRDGHIMYLYNAAVPVRPRGDYHFWAGIVPGDTSELIWDPKKIVPYDQLPKVIDPPTGWIQNSNDTPWTSTYPRALDSSKFPPYLAPPEGITTRAQRGTRTLSPSRKMTFEDVKAGKLSTHVETADQYVDDLIAAARKLGTDRAKQAANVLAKWDRSADNESDGTLLFYRFLLAAGHAFQSIGGYAVPSNEHKPLDTPRGFADSARAVKALDTVAADIEKQYGSLHVKWGDVLRLRRGSLDLPGNGAPSMMGAIRTVDPGPFIDGKAAGVAGDTYYAVIEYSTPIRAEALLGYGNWSKVGSKHVEDQLPLFSNKQMRPVLRSRSEIEANLESKKVF